MPRDRVRSAMDQHSPDHVQPMFVNEYATLAEIFILKLDTENKSIVIKYNLRK